MTARFTATRSHDENWWLLDREAGRCVQFAGGPGPTRRDDVRAWARILNGAAEDESEAVFALARLVGQPTAATREVVAEILDQQEQVHLPWGLPCGKPGHPAGVHNCSVADVVTKLYGQPAEWTPRSFEERNTGARIDWEPGVAAWRITYAGGARGPAYADPDVARYHALNPPADVLLGAPE